MRRSIRGKLENSGGTCARRKEKCGKGDKRRRQQFICFGPWIGQTETKWKEIDDGSGKSQVKPEQKR